jgi:hypothetical protein
METRIEKVVNPREWRVTQENVHADGKLVSTTDLQSGMGWKFNQKSGQMERFTLTSEQASMGRLPPPLSDLRSMSNEALQVHHRENASAMEESLAEVKRLGQSRSPARLGAASEQASSSSVDPALPYAQQFRKSASELWGARQQMVERGMPLPEAPGHSDQRTLKPQQPLARQTEPVSASDSPQKSPAPAPAEQGLVMAR